MPWHLHAPLREPRSFPEAIALGSLHLHKHRCKLKGFVGAKIEKKSATRWLPLYFTENQYTSLICSLG